MRGALAAIVLMWGCGGPSVVEEDHARAPAARGRSSRCPADQTRLGAECWSARGTRWRVEAEGPGGEYEFDLELMAAGRTRASDHEGASPATDEWFQTGRLLRVFLADRFVEYRARVTNGTVLLGEARNVRGQRWSWRAQRTFADASCAEDELLLDGACMTVSGSRWRIEGDGAEELPLLEFRRAGQLGTGATAEREPAGEWAQEGSVVRVVFASGAAVEAELESEDELRGRWTAGTRTGELRGTRVASIAPVIHR